jgi:hypothetical protein
MRSTLVQETTASLRSQEGIRRRAVGKKAVGKKAVGKKALQAREEARMDDGFASLARGQSQEGRWQEGTAGQKRIRK